MDGFWSPVLESGIDPVRNGTNYGTKRMEQLLKETVQTPFIQKSTNSHWMVTWLLDGRSFYSMNNIKRSKERSLNGHMTVPFTKRTVTKRSCDRSMTICFMMYRSMTVRAVRWPLVYFIMNGAVRVTNERSGPSDKRTEQSNERNGHDPKTKTVHTYWIQHEERFDQEEFLLSQSNL